MSKGAKRTKGNTKPSSSSNAFNLFLKYNGSTETSNCSDLVNYESLTCESNHEIFVAIKKCSKKDIVTKTKGLKDILDIFTNNTTDDYSFLLKQWIKVFLNLANDDDFQVREATLTTFEQINKLVKSQLQPFLKQIVPIWLCLAGDTYGNVSKIASQAFSSTFSKQKLNEVFLFSKEQIIANVNTILFKTNYTNKKNEIRLIPGAFYSLIVLSKISKDDELLNDQLIKVLDNEQFWKYSKFNDNYVQVSWFNLINSLLLIKFNLIEQHLKKINQHTLNRLNDKNVSLQESIWKVVFTLIKLDEATYFNELNYDKVKKSFYDILKRNSFDQQLLISNLNLILKYFLFKNENNERELIDDLFNTFEQEILTKKDQTIAIDLYFQTLLFILQNSELIPLNHEIFNQLINQKLKSIIEQLSTDSKCLQELFKKFVTFSSDLKSLNYEIEVQLVNELILKSVQTKLEDNLREEEFNFQFIKSLFNIIFNSKAYQSRTKLNLFITNGIESIEFLKYKFEFYEQSDNLSTKRDLFSKILQNVFNLSQSNFDENFIEFLNYLVQFASYLDVLNDKIRENFSSFLSKINRQLIEKSNKHQIIKLFYVIQQINLKSNGSIDKFIDFNDSMNIFAFIFTLQLFKDENDHNLSTINLLSLYDVLFERFRNCLQTKTLRLSLKELDLDDENEDELRNTKMIQKMINLLVEEDELNLVNTIYSLLNLKLNESIYEIIFNKLVQLNQNDEVNILLFLILDHLNRFNKVLNVKSIECLIFQFIEFTNHITMEFGRNLWSDVLFKSLKQNSTNSSDAICNLTTKFKQFLLNQRSIAFDQLNLIISNIYTFIIKLSNLNDDHSTSLDVLIKSIIPAENEFESLKNELNAKVFEFMWIKDDLADYNFKIEELESKELKLPHLIRLSYASLRIVKLLNFKNNLELDIDNLMNESTDQQIANLLQTNSEFDYLFNISTLSYCYLKLLDQIHSYGMSPTNPNDMIESFIHFYEQFYCKFDQQFIKSFANRTYQIDHENIWTIASIHHLLNASRMDNVFDFESINKSLKLNSFSLIMKFIPKQDLEQFLQQIIQYNLVDKANDPDNFENFDNFKEYLDIISICLKNYLITIDFHRYLSPIINCIISYQEKIQSKEKIDQFYFDFSNDQSLKNQFNDHQFISTIVSVINFLDQVIRRSSEDLSAKFQFSSFLFYSLIKWTEILNQDINLLMSNNHLCNYLNRLFSLIKNLAFLMQLNVSNLRKSRSNWLENFSFKINERLFRFFLRLSRLEIKFVHYDMIDTLGKCLIEIDNGNLTRVQFKDIDLDAFNDWKSELESKRTDDENDDLSNIKLSIKQERLFNILSSLLMKRSSLYSLTAHELMKNYLYQLADELNRDQDFLVNLEDRIYLKPPNFILDIMNVINMKLNENESNFDEQSNSIKIVYFLVWDQLFEFWCKLNEQIKYTIANYLKDKGMIDDLFVQFNNILPIDKQLLEVYYKHGLTKSKILEYFLNPLKLDPANLWHINTLYHLNCQIYLKIFKKMPTTMRLWINTAAAQAQIKEFTTKFVSEIVIKDELKTIQDQASNSLENLRLKVRSSTNEILTFYSFEDCKIELTLTLPNNYPIGLIKINSGERVGVDLAKWRSYELQLTTFLATNVSIFDGIVVWLNNIKKTLELCEECMICFYVLQSSNYQLPKISCKYCRKKFHRVCLSKWFAKSNKKQCPLCRNDM